MRAESANDSPSPYSVWFGKSVVLLLAVRQGHIPLPAALLLNVVPTCVFPCSPDGRSTSKKS